MEKPCRSDVATPTGLVQRVTVQYFFDHVLPPLPPAFAVDDIVRSMRRSGKKGQRLITQRGRWRGFSQEPQFNPRDKRSTFAHLAAIVDAISKAGVAHGHIPTTEFVQHIHEEGDIDETTSPDGCVRLKGGEQETWENIAAVGWYSKSNNPAHSYRGTQRMQRSLAHGMNSARRRFLFGYTVLNASMEFWFVDRTQSLVSDPVEWITDHSTVTHFFVALLYSQPHDLGWDMTVTAAGDSQYDIVIEDARGKQMQYRTLELIASSQSETNGKGTRVWRAVELRNGLPHGDPVVVKDVWRHGELEQEGTIIRAIRDSGLNEEEQLFLDDHLPTVLLHGDVVIHSKSSVDPVHLDCTQAHIRNFECLCAGQPLAEPAILPPGTRLGPYLSDTFESMGRSELRGRRIHYRIVFKEDCTPIHRQKSPAVVFDALADVASVIRILHAHGWVHRDLSYGNVLLDSKARMRLIDFEFAKKYADEKVPEFRVGTSSFMAAEIHRQTYLFTPGSAPPLNVVKGLSKRHPLLDGDDDDFELAPGPWDPPPSTDTSDLDCSFFYNPLHDLESLWWLGGYFVFDHGRRLHRQAIRKDTERKTCRPIRLRFPQDLFDNHDRRHNVMRITGDFACYASYLPQCLRPAAAALEKLRRELMSSYEEVEKSNEAMSKPVFASLYDSFADGMRSIAKVVSATPKTDQKAPPVHSRKRSRKDDTPVCTKIAPVDSKRPRVA